VLHWRLPFLFIKLATRKFITKYHLWKNKLNLTAPRTVGAMLKSSQKKITATCLKQASNMVTRLSKTALRAIEMYVIEEPKENILKKKLRNNFE
jgi:hypothetical protein